MRVGNRLLEEEVREGNDVRPWSHKGFVGWACGGVDMGQRSDCSIVRLRSTTARESWFDVYQEATNCSRLDLQVTVRFDSTEPAAIIHKCWKVAQRVKAYGKAQEWHLRRDSSKGNTLELGRRVSDRWARIYDKRLQSKLAHYDGCVRFEMQTGNRTALRYAGALADGRSSYHSIIRILRSYFEDRGIYLDLPADGVETISLPPKSSDLDRWLEWAKTGVRPRVKQAVERDRMPEVIEALGLTGFVSICNTTLAHVGQSTKKEKGNGSNRGDPDGNNIGPDA